MGYSGHILLDISPSQVCRRYEAGIEEGLEAAYQGYLARKGIREEAAKAKRARLGDDDNPADLATDDERGGEGAEPVVAPADSDDEVCL